MAAGCTAVKTNAADRLRAIDTPHAARQVVRRAEEARAVLGDDRDLAIDCHGRASSATARRLLAVLADVAPMFVEEPVLPEQPHIGGDLVRASPIPLATGERLYSRRDSPRAEGVAVAQPDLSRAGGVSEVRRIAAPAEMYGARLAPHCPLGRVALAASPQLGSPCRTSSATRPGRAHPASASRSTTRRVRRAAATGHAWRNPVWRHDDGGLAEW